MARESDIDTNAESERVREQNRVERDQGITHAESERVREQNRVERDQGNQGVKKTYTVKPGDTLSGIAQSEMGHANRWPELYAANKEAVGANPDMIHPGLKLEIPV